MQGARGVQLCALVLGVFKINTGDHHGNLICRTTTWANRERIWGRKHGNTSTLQLLQRYSNHHLRVIKWHPFQFSLGCTCSAPFQSSLFGACSLAHLATDAALQFGFLAGGLSLLRFKCFEKETVGNNLNVGEFFQSRDIRGGIIYRGFISFYFFLFLFISFISFYFFLFLIPYFLCKGNLSTIASKSGGGQNFAAGAEAAVSRSRHRCDWRWCIRVMSQGKFGLRHLSFYFHSMSCTTSFRRVSKWHPSCELCSLKQPGEIWLLVSKQFIQRPCDCNNGLALVSHLFVESEVSGSGIEPKNAHQSGCMQTGNEGLTKSSDLLGELNTAQDKVQTQTTQKLLGLG